MVTPEKKQDEALLNQLQSILLREDRATVQQLREAMEDPELISERVGPIIERRMAFFKENFPKEFQVTVDKMIERKLKASQEVILDVIYPVMGKMIKKYVNHQIQMVKDGIDETIKKTFSKRGFFWQLKSKLFGMKASDQVIHEMKDYKIEEVYVTQRNSGLLFGSASAEKTIDQDVIAGMLTAIKSFVEDAFKREREDLEMIQYGTYKILLQNFYSYYIAVAISGSMSSSEREELGNRLLNFAEKNLKKLPSEPDGPTFELVSMALYKKFIQS
ncbi:MAG: hypothetical protein AAF960_25900 [Bacteroidota bacterium]